MEMCSAIQEGTISVHKKNEHVMRDPKEEPLSPAKNPSEPVFEQPQVVQRMASNWLPSTSSSMSSVMVVAGASGATAYFTAASRREDTEMSDFYGSTGRTPVGVFKPSATTRTSNMQQKPISTDTRQTRISSTDTLHQKQAAIPTRIESNDEFINKNSVQRVVAAQSNMIPAPCLPAAGPSNRNLTQRLPIRVQCNTSSAVQRGSTTAPGNRVSVHEHTNVNFYPIPAPRTTSGPFNASSSQRAKLNGPYFMRFGGGPLRGPFYGNYPGTSSKPKGQPNSATGQFYNDNGQRGQTAATSITMVAPPEVKSVLPTSSNDTIRHNLVLRSSPPQIGDEFETTPPVKKSMERAPLPENSVLALWRKMQVEKRKIADPEAAQHLTPSACGSPESTPPDSPSRCQMSPTSLRVLEPSNRRRRRNSVLALWRKVQFEKRLMTDRNSAQHYHQNLKSVKEMRMTNTSSASAARKNFDSKTPVLEQIEYKMKVAPPPEKNDQYLIPWLQPGTTTEDDDKDRASVRSLDEDNTHVRCFICNDKLDNENLQKSNCSTCQRVFHEDCVFPNFLAGNWSDVDFQCIGCQPIPDQTEEFKVGSLTTRERIVRRSNHAQYFDLQICAKILFACFESRRSFNLLLAVPPNLAGYKNFVRTPFGFKDVAERLEPSHQMAIKSCSEFIACMNRVFHNCIMFNTAKYDDVGFNNGKRVWRLYKKAVAQYLPFFSLDVPDFVPHVPKKRLPKLPALTAPTGKSRRKRTKNAGIGSSGSALKKRRDEVKAEPFVMLE